MHNTSYYMYKGNQVFVILQLMGHRWAFSEENNVKNVDN
jgi:hypothetical protein